MEHFNEWMKKERKARNLTLDQVAKKLRTHKGYVSGIENAKVNPPSPRICRRIAALFNMHPGQVLAMAMIDKAPLEIRGPLRAHLYLHPVKWENFDGDKAPAAAPQKAVV